MPLLTRYLLRLFLPLFGACLALFLGVLLMNQFLRLFSLAMMKGISPLWIVSCFLRLLPSFATIAAPMAFLVALMVALGQLTESGQTMALRASGFSFGEITRPFLAAAAALSLVLLLVNHKAGPEGYRSFRRRLAEASAQLTRLEIRPRAFTALGPWRLYARDYREADGRLEGVYLVKAGGEGGAVRLNARGGSLRLEPGRLVELILEDGELQLPNPEPERFTSGRFKTYRVVTPLSGAVPPRGELDIQEMTTGQLLAKAGSGALSRERRLEHRVEAAARSAGALAPFVLFWLGAPLGLGLRRRARGADFAASLGVLFAYYGLMVLGVGLGRRHELLSSWTPWLADAAALLAGGWLTRRASAL